MKEIVVQAKNDEKNGEKWTASMPEHWLKQADEREFDINRVNEASSLIIKAATGESERTTGNPTPAGAKIYDAVSTTALIKSA